VRNPKLNIVIRTWPERAYLKNWLEIMKVTIEDQIYDYEYTPGFCKGVNLTSLKHELTLCKRLIKILNDKKQVNDIMACPLCGQAKYVELHKDSGIGCMRCDLWLNGISDEEVTKTWSHRIAS